jgi:hypothetical protein
MVFRSLVDVRLGAQLAAFTLAAIAAAWFWALPPMTTSLLYLCPHNWSDADLVRHLWHFRFVQPQLVASPPQYDYLRWAQAETLARLSVVLLGWISGGGWVLWRHFRGRTVPRPTPPASVDGGILFPFHARRPRPAATEQVRWASGRSLK